MNTEFWLFGQFNSATLGVDQVLQVVGVKVRTLRNWISEGKFPRPLPGDRFAIQDVATWIDEERRKAAA